ncbi:hypothetical protein ACKI1J_38840 [Streptomyces scabiei]|uniref:hypothetical protein n=1 Tax=Streptomyces scabiei TaxID=1930 RepID=UPI0039EDEACA
MRLRRHRPQPAPPAPEAEPDHQPGPQPFTCPRCARTSHHPLDRRYGYCSACNDYTGAPA